MPPEQLLVGAVYWAVAAHLYSRETLGRSSALIAALILASNLAQLNLHSALPRFLPRAGRSAGRLITYSYAMSSLAALAVGLGFVLILPRLSSSWRFLGDSARWLSCSSLRQSSGGCSTSRMPPS